MNATVLCFNSLVRLAATLRFEILLVASSAVYCRRVGAAERLQVEVLVQLQSVILYCHFRSDADSTM